MEFLLVYSDRQGAGFREHMVGLRGFRRMRLLSRDSEKTAAGLRDSRPGGG